MPGVIAYALISLLLCCHFALLTDCHLARENAEFGKVEIDVDQITFCESLETLLFC